MSVTKRESRTSWPATGLAWPEERVDRAFRDMFRDLFAGRPLGERFAEGGLNPIHLEEFVDNGTCVIRAELPGIDPDKDVEITVDHGILTVHAEKTEEKREGKRSEFLYGSFTRSVQLPEGVKEDDIKAGYNHGVLTVTAPTGPVTGHSRKIPIDTSS